MRVIALVGAAGCVAWSFHLEGHPATFWCGITALVLVASAIGSRRPWIGVAGVFALAAQYALALDLSDVEVDAGAPFIGLGLFLILEGTDATAGRLRPERTAGSRALSLTITAASALGGLVLGAVALVAGAAVRGGGAPLFLIAVVAAVAVLYLLTLLARDRVPGG